MEDLNYYPEALEDDEADEGSSDQDASGEGDGEEESEEERRDVFKRECITTHPVLCETAPPHPLVRDRGLSSYHWQKLKEQGLVNLLTES